MQAHRSRSGKESKPSDYGKGIARGIFLLALVSVCLGLGAGGGWARPDKGSPATQAQEREKGRWIHLQAFNFDPLVETPALPSNLRFERPGRNEVTYYLVQFN